MKTKLSEKLTELRELSNRLDEIKDSLDFNREEKKRIKEVVDILDNKIYEWEELKREEMN
nr:uncharacterized protein [uncultured phage]